MRSELVCLEGHGEHPCATWPLDLSKDAFMTRSLNVPSRTDRMRADTAASARLVPPTQGWKRPDSARRPRDVSKYLP